MIDQAVYRIVQDHDFLLMPALDLRRYIWASLQVYPETVQTRLGQYHSKLDLLHWFTFWTELWRCASPFHGQESYDRLKNDSSQRHDIVLKRIFSTYKENTDIHSGYDIWNAIDAHIIFENCRSTENVLDFGGGYGRLGLIFGDHERTRNYVCIDSVELAYMLQSLVLSAFRPEKFFEYIEYAFARQSFIMDFENLPGIYHVPAWQWNLVPNESIDVITAVFVLPEINEFALNDFINQALRTLKPGGYLYVRDHLYTTGENNHTGAHKLNTEELLQRNRFRLVYSGDFSDNVEIYGIPRVYQLDTQP